ncbi:MAG: hypothetical protein ACKVS9_13985 [Phycisphaerae bacterium]
MRLMIVVAAVLVALAGCAGPGPSYFPVAPVETRAIDGGLIERLYDSDRDGVADIGEIFDTIGRVARLAYDRGADGRFGSAVDWPPAADAAGVRRLLIIVDSVPYAMIRQLYDQGRFRLFHPPGRTVSPFPVMTDPALADYFGVLPLPGVEAQYFDGQRLQSGFDNYVNATNMTWLRHIDYALAVPYHGPAYLWPGVWFDDELRHIQDGFLQSEKREYAGYVVGGSAMGAKRGRDGHQTLLIRLDRYCQSLIHRHRGKLHITLMSDHGHHLGPQTRVPLAWHLKRVGYNVGDRIEHATDIVVPEWGPVSCAVVHTRVPERVARDAVGFEGVELAAYRDESGAVIVVGRDGDGRIEHKDGKFRYSSRRGDPLNLLPILDRLRQGSGDDGFIDDAILLRATADHEFPDAIRRLWRAFDGMFENTPQVFISLADGYYCGDQQFEQYLTMRGVHGNLRSAGSCGFVMHTDRAAAALARIGDLRSSE